MKVLQVIDQAFRTTAEEQDDTILWLTQSMHSAGGNLKVLLSGHGVYYAVQKQSQPALSIATWQQTQPADLNRDLSHMIGSGIPIYVVSEDLHDRGLRAEDFVEGIQSINRRDLTNLYESVDQIWHW